MIKEIIHYSEFANMVDCREMLDSIKRSIDGTSTEWQTDWVDSPFVLIGDKVFEVIADD